MRYVSILIASLVGILAPISVAFAHFGLAGDDEVGHALFWIYGILLIGIATFVIYRKAIGSKESPERRSLKRQLSELERALASRTTQLKYAKDYPNECGLSDEQRREVIESVTSIRIQISKAKSELATA